MNGINKEVLHDLLIKLAEVRNQQQLDELTSEFSDKLGADSSAILDDIRKIGSELVFLRGGTDDKGSRLLAARTEQERSELAEVRKIIDENLFNYHFQPIVNTVDGEIYSYEALMRPRSSLCPSPYHVIKYAEIMERMDDIESATFLNVLSIIDNRESDFHGRPVFINSIPSAALNENDFNRIRKMLEKHSGSVVVEMTEQAEMGEDEFGQIKEMYAALNVKMAIDDYGTGYSNVQNLLKYMPDYVKIDRSLMSEIHENRRKRHFVREIIDFCHDNGILALAEGVETSEELHTAVKLGADLIQGYYTAKPSAEIMESIPYEIKQEIKRYRQEREDGKKLHIYTVGKSERVLLDRMKKENYRCILIGKEGSGDVTLASSPGVDTNMHLEIANGFTGSVILDNTTLSNVKKRPCINIGENCDVKLVLVGTNYLKNGGIRVPESSRLTVTGEGDLSILINGSGYYAIGNDIDSRHGELVFEQGITVDNHASEGVCIGSGLGGKISFIRGQYQFNMRGYRGVGIGAVYADTSLEIFACNITIDMSVEMGVAIGSLEKNCSAVIHHSAVKVFASGTDVAGIGTLNGEKCDVEIREANFVSNINADRCSAVAAFEGSTNFLLNKAGMHIVSRGDNAVIIGGYNENVNCMLRNSDSTVDLITKIDKFNYNIAEKMVIEGGRSRVILNGEEMITEL